jgi:hypothetical protein
MCFGPVTSEAINGILITVSSLEDNSILARSEASNIF